MEERWFIMRALVIELPVARSIWCTTTEVLAQHSTETISSEEYVNLHLCEFTLAGVSYWSAWTGFHSSDSFLAKKKMLSPWSPLPLSAFSFLLFPHHKRKNGDFLENILEQIKNAKSREVIFKLYWISSMEYVYVRRNYSGRKLERRIFLYTFT